MNILIINGSPKGKYSVTLQTCLYLEKLHPEHHFEQLHAGQRIRSYEKDFSEARIAIAKADILLFSYPVYTFLVPSQLHRFIELMKAEGLDYSGKVATQITTSKHFYDVTAHRFVEDNCADMGLKFIDGLSADMDDLLTEKGRREADDFFDFLLWNVQKGYSKVPSIAHESSDYTPVPLSHADLLKVQPAIDSLPTSDAKRKSVAIVADMTIDDSQLRAMVTHLKARLPFACEIINIRDFPFMGGCISCFNCATTGKCFYKDGFDDYLRGTIHSHNAIVYAFRVQDHSMGSRFKMYDDRQFCNGHRTVTMGTPFAYLVSGPLSREENLRTVIEARAQVGGNFLAGIATDEKCPEEEIAKLAETLTYAIEHQYVQPQNFYGVGGMKIFRDLIYLMRGMMRADHRFFKSHGQYDFPQKKRATAMKMYLVGWLMGNRKLKAKMGSKLNDGMIKPYTDVVAQASPKTAEKPKD